MNSFIAWIKGISPEVVTAIIAAIVAIITIIYNKRKEISINQRNIKEEKYIAFLSSFISLRAGVDTEQNLTETLQVINLIGTPEVVKNTNAFVGLFTDNSTSDKKIDKEEQNKLYSDLIKSMRKDLYGRKSNKHFPEQLPLILAQNGSLRTKKQLVELLQAIQK